MHAVIEMSKPGFIKLACLNEEQNDGHYLICLGLKFFLWNQIAWFLLESVEPSQICLRSRKPVLNAVVDQLRSRKISHASSSTISENL